MEVVILAAGLGTRLGMGPKPLVKIGGITLLERQIITLNTVVKPTYIHVVAGPEFDAVRNICSRYFNAHPIFNPFYQISGCIASAFMATPYLKSDEILRIDGDLLFTDLMSLARFVETPSTLLATSVAMFADQPTVALKGGCAQVIHAADDPLSQDDTAQWLCIELYKHGEFKRLVMEAPDIVKHPYFHAINHYIAHQSDGRTTFRARDMLGVYEIDTAEDLERANQAI